MPRWLAALAASCDTGDGQSAKDTWDIVVQDVQCSVGRTLRNVKRVVDRNRYVRLEVHVDGHAGGLLVTALINDDILEHITPCETVGGRVGNRTAIFNN